MKLLIALAASILSAETATVVFTPEPMASSRAALGNIPGVGTWSVRICSDSTEPVSLDTGRVYMEAAAHISPIGKSRSLLLLEHGRRDRPVLRVARVIKWVTIGATVIGAIEGVSPSVTRRLALLIPIAHEGASRLEERAPAFDSAELLDGKLILEPWGCAERTILAAVQRGARPLRLKIPLPPAPLPRGVSSIPSKGLQ